jgi:hypothetical protein
MSDLWRAEEAAAVRLVRGGQDAIKECEINA